MFKNLYNCLKLSGPKIGKLKNIKKIIHLRNALKFTAFFKLKNLLS